VPPGRERALALFGRWQLLRLKGFAPQLNRCAGCGAAIRVAPPPAFSVQEGGALCRVCSRGRVGLSRAEFAALNAFLHGDADLAVEWPLPPDAGRRLSRIQEEFAAYHAGLAFKQEGGGLRGGRSGGNEGP